MEMCYDGALVMPNNYAVVDEEEMTYQNGGWTVSNTMLFSSGEAAYKDFNLLSHIFEVSAWVLAIDLTYAGVCLGGLLGGIIGAAGGVIAGTYIMQWKQAFDGAAKDAKKYNLPVIAALTCVNASLYIDVHPAIMCG